MLKNSFSSNKALNNFSNLFFGTSDNRTLFHSKSGILEVILDNDLYTLDFPSRMPKPASLPAAIKDALDMQPNEVLLARDCIGV